MTNDKVVIITEEVNPEYVAQLKIAMSYLELPYTKAIVSINIHLDGVNFQSNTTAREDKAASRLIEKNAVKIEDKND